MIFVHELLANAYNNILCRATIAGLANSSSGHPITNCSSQLLIVWGLLALEKRDESWRLLSRLRQQAIKLPQYHPQGTPPPSVTPSLPPVGTPSCRLCLGIDQSFPPFKRLRGLRLGINQSLPPYKWLRGLHLGIDWSIIPSLQICETNCQVPSRDWRCVWQSTVNTCSVDNSELPKLQARDSQEWSLHKNLNYLFAQIQVITLITCTCFPPWQSKFRGSRQGVKTI